jgi:hypothetical protein
MIGLVAAAATTQHYRWRSVRADLADVTPAYVAAVNAQSRLANLQRQVDHARACAELYTYLRHPWPRTQLLAAMLGPLPDEIILQTVQIVREPAGASSPAGARPQTGGKSHDESLAALLPARRDLATLRDRIEPTRTIMVLTGTATASSAVYRYLGELDAAKIFDKAELDWLDNADGGRSVRFQVVLGVQPGYGQFGGASRGGNRP